MDVREKLSNGKRLIDADAFLEKMKRTSRYFDVVFDVEDMPTVDAVEVVNGRWIGVDSSYWRWSHDGGHTVEHITFRCSECARKSIIKTNYCPNCGADMRGSKDE